MPHVPVVLMYAPCACDQNKFSTRAYTFKCLSHRKPCKIQKFVTKLISVRKKSYTFSKYLMPSILKYIILW
jgi:hypothetical protein